MANEIDFWQARKDFLVEPVIADGQPFAQGGIPEVIYSGGARVLLSKNDHANVTAKSFIPTIFSSTGGLIAKHKANIK
jgi:hypothetical protein